MFLVRISIIPRLKSKLLECFYCHWATWLIQPFDLCLCYTFCHQNLKAKHLVLVFPAISNSLPDYRVPRILLPFRGSVYYDAHKQVTLHLPIWLAPVTHNLNIRSPTLKLQHILRVSHTLKLSFEFQRVIQPFEPYYCPSRVVSSSFTRVH